MWRVVLCTLTVFALTCEGLNTTSHGIPRRRNSSLPAASAYHRCSSSCRFVNTTRLSPLNWLHVPKCGTSFGATVFHYACPLLPTNVTLPSTTKPLVTLMRRYPIRKYCLPGVFDQHPPVNHVPMPRNVVAREAVASNTVCMFREPKQRALSHWFMWKHSAEKHSRSEQSTESMLATSEGSYAMTSVLQSFAGCTAGMLVGRRCHATFSDWKKSHFEMPKILSTDITAAVSLVSKLGFVGLVEHWDESVCLFHAMLGGKLFPNEFALVREGARSDLKGEDGFYRHDLAPDYRDVADDAVYAEATRVFWHRYALYGCGANRDRG